jgi:dienelactone hydrolase
MDNAHTFGIATLLSLAASAAFCDPATRPANPWNPSLLRYDAVVPIVEESTPTPAQLDFWKRPPALKADAPAPTATSGAKPAEVGPVEITRLRFRDAKGEDVPLLLCKPKGKSGPFPVVIALHGIGSNKTQVCGQVAPAFAKHGFAVLAMDLPLHGERPGDPRQFANFAELPKALTLCRQAVIDLRQCIDIAEARADLDTKSGVLLAGYSLGALIDSVAGPADSRVQGMVLMVGGAPDFPPALSLLPELASLNPLLAIPHFAGRPLLMLNGDTDQTITRAMGERLFAAADEPKEQRWYDCGHMLPAKAYEDGAQWAADTWKALLKKAKVAKAK